MPNETAHLRIGANSPERKAESGKGTGIGGVPVAMIYG